MARKLAGYTQVDGTWYGPDDEVPEDVAKRITNPSAWVPDTKTGEPTSVADPSPSRRRTHKTA